MAGGDGGRRWLKTMAGPGKPRGRPKKAHEDLIAKCRMRLEGEEWVKERVLAGMTWEEVKAAEREPNIKPRQRKVASQQDRDGVLRRQHGQGLDGVVTRTTRKENERQSKALSRGGSQQQAECGRERR